MNRAWGQTRQYMKETSMESSTNLLWSLYRSENL